MKISTKLALLPVVALAGISLIVTLLVVDIRVVTRCNYCTDVTPFQVGTPHSITR